MPGSYCCRMQCSVRNLLRQCNTHIHCQNSMLKLMSDASGVGKSFKVLKHGGNS